MDTIIHYFTSTFCILIGAVTGALVGLFVCCATADLIKYLFEKNK